MSKIPTKLFNLVIAKHITSLYTVSTCFLIGTHNYKQKYKAKVLKFKHSLSAFFFCLCFCSMKIPFKYMYWGKNTVLENVKICFQLKLKMQIGHCLLCENFCCLQTLGTSGINLLLV